MLRWPGGKKKPARQILAYAPDFEEFRDPFVGGNGLLLALPPGKKIWINDKSDWVVNFWTWIRDDPNCIDAIMRRKEICGRITEEKAARTFFTDCKLRFQEQHLPLDYLCLNIWSVSAIVSPLRRDIASFSSLLNRDGWNAISEHKVQAYHEKLQGARITCGDYSVLLTARGKKVWTFCDPPYLVQDHMSPLYPHPFEREDHEELARRLKKCRHDWFLTTGDSEFSERLYAGYPMRRRLYKNSMTHRHKNKNSADRNRTELWIMKK